MIDASAWATWTGAAVALAAAIVASVQAGRANAAAHRSAVADERAAAAAERANELAERQAAKYVPAWRLTRIGPMTAQLDNDSEEAALGVAVSHLDGTNLWIDAQPAEDLQPGESMQIAVSLHTQLGTTMLVRWRRPNGEERSQRVAIEGR